MDLKKDFDRVEHDILLTRCEHYGVRGLENDWFKSYMPDRKQFVSIYGLASYLASVLYGVPQGSVLNPLLFLICIKESNQATKFCEVHHFADDRNLLHLSKSITKLNKYVNVDMKKLTNWLNGKDLFKKTELVIFKHQRKKIDNKVKIKLSRKQLCPTDSVKYFGIRIDEKLNRKHPVNDTAIKVNRGNALLFKIRKFVSVNTFKTMMQSLTYILIMPMWFGLKILMP